jgi:hypothetical protein
MLPAGRRSAVLGSFEPGPIPNENEKTGVGAHKKPMKVPLLLATARTASVVAASRCDLFVLEKSRLQSRPAGHPAVCRRNRGPRQRAL